MEVRYAEGCKNNEWDELRNEMETAYSHETERAQGIIEAAKNYKEELDGLRQNRNQLLQKIALKYPNEFVSQIINDVSQYKPIDFCESDLDFSSERFFKMTVFQMLVSMDALKGGEIEDAFPKETFKLFYAIRLYDLRQRLEESVDENTKQHIIDIESFYIEHIALAYNERYLTYLTSHAHADNEAEILVAELMNDFQTSQEELLKKHLLDGSSIDL
jgi:hypothetical protein